MDARGNRGRRLRRFFIKGTPQRAGTDRDSCCRKVDWYWQCITSPPCTGGTRAGMRSLRLASRGG
jgi:hypothetical protein